MAWVRPGDAIAMGRRKEIVLWPPTAVTLAELAACRDVAAALAPRTGQAGAAGGERGRGRGLADPPGELEYPL